MKKNKDVNPCPFCTSKNCSIHIKTIDRYISGSIYEAYVMCDHCLARGPLFCEPILRVSWRQAQEAWNIKSK